MRWLPPAPSSRKMSLLTAWSRASRRNSSAGCANAGVPSTETCDAPTTAKNSQSRNQRGAALVPRAASERRTFIGRRRFRASMIPIARPLLGDEELAAVREVLASGMLAQGPKVEAFEKAFAKDLGRKHAIAVTNGTAALHVALLAHGIGPGKKAGNLGDTACFSFYATKNMTTGEGGMIVTDDDRIAERARLLRHHGQPAKYEHVLVGFNYRMTEIAAAIGLAQLAKLDGWVKQRRANARALSKGLDDIEGLVPPSEGNWMVHSYYQYIVRREEPFPRSREEIVQDLTEDGVGCRPSYPVAPYKQNTPRDLKIPGRCPVAEDRVPGLLQLPVHPGVGPAEIERIVAAVEEVARTD